jgi:hypothetical protein
LKLTSRVHKVTHTDTFREGFALGYVEKIKMAEIQ